MLTSPKLQLLPTSLHHHINSPRLQLLSFSFCNALQLLITFLHAAQMATEKPTIYQTPDWETRPTPKKGLLSKYNIFKARSSPATEEDPAERATTTKRTFSDRFIPHWFAPCFGRNRRTCLCAFAALVLLALVLGLGLGLGLHKGWVDLNTFHPGTPI